MKQTAFFKHTVILGLLLVCMCCVSAQAFLFEITPQDKTAVARMTDDLLIDTYIDVMIELEAANKFYDNAGLKPKEYEQYKKLLRYRTDLIIEIQKRKMEIPKIEP